MSPVRGIQVELARPVACARRELPGTWRVVFSSSGDLAPERKAVHGRGLQGRLWIHAARHPLRIALGSAPSVLPFTGHICHRKLLQPAKIPVFPLGPSWWISADLTAGSVCGAALGFRHAGGTDSGVGPGMHPRLDLATSFLAVTAGCDVGCIYSTTSHSGALCESRPKGISTDEKHVAERVEAAAG